ncbi:MAG: DUF2334 domain-containing protein [Aquificaceae bacterium]|nr:DUF2334 domain-containing protein [Aquificaceae bacterium]
MSLFLLELHDVSPYYRKEFFKALDLLEEVGLDGFSLLIVPYFWERAPLGEDKDFVSFIKSLPAEVVLHGYTHKGNKRFKDLLWTDGEGEFGGLDLISTYEKVYLALEFMDYLGIKTEFFVPPAWIGNPYLDDVLYSLGFRAVAYRWYIKDLSTEKIIKSPAISFSNRHLFSWFSLMLVPELERLYKKHKLLRLAIHMADLRDERKILLWKEILNKFKERRRCVSYGELFGKSGPSSSFKGFQSAGRLV